MEIELECLVNVFGTADWRRRKAEEYPSDLRNIQAAELLDSLARDLGEFEGSSLHNQLINLWRDTETFNEVVSEELRNVGFWSFPESADELLRSIIARLQT